jgi:hypothetical protein
MSLAAQQRDRVVQRHARAGDRGGAGAAVGLQHVAVDGEGAFTERLEVDRGTQAAADQALDLLGAPALLAGRGLALHAAAGGARQHAVLGGDPALALALEEARDLLVDAHVAQHARVAELDQHRALGVLGVLAGEADGTELIGRTAARAHGEPRFGNG